MSQCGQIAAMATSPFIPYEQCASAIYCSSEEGIRVERRGQLHSSLFSTFPSPPPPRLQSPPLLRPPCGHVPSPRAADLLLFRVLPAAMALGVASPLISSSSLRTKAREGAARPEAGYGSSTSAYHGLLSHGAPPLLPIPPVAGRRDALLVSHSAAVMGDGGRQRRRSSSPLAAGGALAVEDSRSSRSSSSGTRLDCLEPQLDEEELLSFTNYYLTAGCVLASYAP